MKRVLLVVRMVLWLLLVAFIIAFFVSGQIDFTNVAGFKNYLAQSLRTVFPILIVFLLLVGITLLDKRK
ncbi:hypothetical protein [Secundilactobacillus malefermentans]|uniref:Uncharacterized protein n=1 Tax=Secundilactobacillus malefermentans TaxID=176292 RepID=A0A4R5NN08_9LACO|nr:hypothetical protein [Secundilactobacillus malefermentans]QEA31193.1 hypothetical protein FGL90_02865 [Secundilactobacillus malefermentans]TDG77242.1 hypothetical protein C5L31_000678 [Secundilactobacillus malefermentans]